ncbi:hypothetical protein B0H13DRAFT_2325973 [Mycena leptocephala]|nr:hypothetical protein B0H13DRAFT_2325973 [Mycena leptocephala]
MALETLEAISHRAIPRDKVHDAHQLQLADSVHGIFTTERFPDLLPVIVNFECWTMYAKQPKFGACDERPWLYDPVARAERLKVPSRIMKGNWNRPRRPPPYWSA